MEIKNQIYITISVFLLLILFLLLFFIYPLIKELRQKSEELVFQRNNVLMLESQFDEAANFKQKYEDYKANLENSDTLFVDAQNPVNFIEYLEETASDLSIKMQISAPLLSKENAVKSQSFQLSASGRFGEILQLVNKLEAGPFLVRAQRINISTAKSSVEAPAQSGDIFAEISIKVLSK